ncbi:NAD-P-binding protein [Cristinia sonorae]|uniref:NAD-P-binding protein n=1 Tax=Cristinia sonorae TaxID=1940300 RepID=A0A8K0UPC2_9AGAR|nr:NAD-P-binding protein [Cristinia sonorae]
MVPSFLYALLASPIIFAAWRNMQKRQRRRKLIPKSQERVLILGASAGIGRSMALQYAASGAKLCIVGRRQATLDTVKAECLKSRLTAADDTSVLSVVADFTVPEDMVHVRSEVESVWGGLDTVVVCAGVSAIRPLLEVAGLKKPSSKHSTAQVSSEEIQHTVDIVNQASKGNFTGPLIAALTFIPLLQCTSPSPSILLISSLAAIIPAPTRSVYAATKASALLLYQSLAIEHPAVCFSFVIPSTVEGDFRSSAVDRVEGEDVYLESDRKKSALSKDAVAKRSIQAVDSGEKYVFMPYLMGRTGQFLHWWFPWITEGIARKKYNFTP